MRIVAMSGSLVRLDRHPLADHDWRQRCREQLNQSGALVLRQFYNPQPYRRSSMKAMRSAIWLITPSANIMFI
jgi:hypothetical protein